MEITSFKIDHMKLKPGVYLHDVKRLGQLYVTTYDLRFKKPNRGDFLTNSQMHSLEHLIASFYGQFYAKDKIYFGPMGCQTGFYLVVAGKKNLKWLLDTLPRLNTYINTTNKIPGDSRNKCGNYKSLNIYVARQAWNNWYRNKVTWEKRYK